MKNNKPNLEEQAKDMKTLDHSLNEILKLLPKVLDLIIKNLHKEANEIIRQEYGNYGKLIDNLVKKYNGMRNTDMYKALLVCDDIISVQYPIVDGIIKEIEPKLEKYLNDNVRIRSVNARKHLRL